MCVRACVCVCVCVRPGVLEQLERKQTALSPIIKECALSRFVVGARFLIVIVIAFL